MEVLTKWIALLAGVTALVTSWGSLITSCPNMQGKTCKDVAQFIKKRA
jgi:hypothetical protein